MKLISQGAEAKIYLTDNKIVKDRIRKEYRIKEIDEKLRGFRTRREERILDKLHKHGFTPKVIECDGKEKLVMEYIEGPRVRDILEKSDYIKLCREIGKKVRIMHENDIIHGDLTTSNMILNEVKKIDKKDESNVSKDDENKDKDNKIFFIDFGLSFVSKKTEDKAVDLHLLKQALESKHYKIWKECFDAVLEEYGKEHHKDVIARLEKVEARGRYKGKGS